MICVLPSPVAADTSRSSPKVGRASCLPRPDKRSVLEPPADPTAVFSIHPKTTLGRQEALPYHAVAVSLRWNDDGGGPSRAATRRLRSREAGRAKAPAEPPCDSLPLIGSSGHTQVVRRPQTSREIRTWSKQAQRRLGGSLRPTEDVGRASLPGQWVFPRALPAWAPPGRARTRGLQCLGWSLRPTGSRRISLLDMSCWVSVRP